VGSRENDNPKNNLRLPFSFGYFLLGKQKKEQSKCNLVPIAIEILVPFYQEKRTNGFIF